jgi:hypothetical protein
MSFALVEKGLAEGRKSVKPELLFLFPLLSYQLELPYNLGTNTILCMRHDFYDLLKQQKSIQEKLTELARKKAEVYPIALEKEKSLVIEH